MNYKPTDPCMCGCPFKEHDSLDGMCWGCYLPPMDFSCLEFKLDNLKYIEEEAKAREV